mmetsp:Transcript_25256/g.51384  ORF Transcript_25256/g.51384 Transcript_25256/m.51384 type:complete len:138 (+) Transcript_25256:158-571(+)
MGDCDSDSSDEIPVAEQVIYQRRKALGFPKMTDSEMLQQSSKEKVLVAVGGCVFDVTAWINEHPGGPLVLQRNTGMDVTDMFNRVGHSDNAREKLAGFFVADLVETEEGQRAIAAAKTKQPPPEPPKVTARKMLPPL